MVQPQTRRKSPSTKLTGLAQKRPDWRRNIRTGVEKSQKCIFLRLAQKFLCSWRCWYILTHTHICLSKQPQHPAAWPLPWSLSFGRWNGLGAFSTPAGTWLRPRAIQISLADRMSLGNQCEKNLLPSSTIYYINISASTPRHLRRSKGPTGMSHCPKVLPVPGVDSTKLSPLNKVKCAGCGCSAPAPGSLQPARIKGGCTRMQTRQNRQNR